jgi:hypothetical protein
MVSASGQASGPQPVQREVGLAAGLRNLATADLDQLTAIVKNRLKSIRYQPGLIDGFLAQTGLILEPEPP